MRHTLTYTQAPTRPEVCGCEHIAHEHPSEHVHAMYAVPAGTRHARYVGAVCDVCADTCMSKYLLPEA